MNQDVNQEDPKAAHVPSGWRDRCWRT